MWYASLKLIKTERLVVEKVRQVPVQSWAGNTLSDVKVAYRYFSNYLLYLLAFNLRLICLGLLLYYMQ